MIDRDAAFRHHLLELALADRVFAVPADALQDDEGAKSAKLEGVHSRIPKRLWSRRAYLNPHTRQCNSRTAVYASRQSPTSSRTLLHSTSRMIVTLGTRMDVYFPIAEMSANAFLIMGVYTVLSCFSVLFGITGSFFGTPALIFFGVPPVVSLGTQIAYLFIASVSSICAQPTFRLPDGWTLAMIAGGIVGVGLGGGLLLSFQRAGNLTLAISLSLFVCLSTIALLMIVELTRSVERRTRRRLFRNRSDPQTKRKRGAIAMSSIWLKPLELLTLFSAGALAGVLTVMTSANGGVFIVPVAILIIQMPYSMVSPNSRLSISAIAAFATLWHVVFIQSVDPVLLLLMVLGACAGVPFGHRLSGIIRPQIARCILAAAALAAATSLAMDLTARPADIFSVDGVVNK